MGAPDCHLLGSRLLLTCVLLLICSFTFCIRGVHCGLFPDTIRHLTPDTFDAELSKAKPVLVAFYAPW